MILTKRGRERDSNNCLSLAQIKRISRKCQESTWHSKDFNSHSFSNLRFRSNNLIMGFFLPRLRFINLSCSFSNICFCNFSLASLFFALFVSSILGGWNGFKSLIISDGTLSHSLKNSCPVALDTQGTGSLS